MMSEWMKSYKSRLVQPTIIKVIYSTMESSGMLHTEEKLFIIFIFYYIIHRH